MTDSILNNTKKMLGISESDTSFDEEIITHINSALLSVGQLGIGPPEGFGIQDETALWTALTLGDKMLNAVRSYVYLRVRLIFDPPATSFLIEAQERQLRELEWRLSSHRESYAWTAPGTEETELFLDGGSVYGNGDPLIYDGGSP